MILHSRRSLGNYIRSENEKSTDTSRSPKVRGCCLERYGTCSRLFLLVFGCCFFVSSLCAEDEKQSDKTTAVEKVAAKAGITEKEEPEKRPVDKDSVRPTSETLRGFARILRNGFASYLHSMKPAAGSETPKTGAARVAKNPSTQKRGDVPLDRVQEVLETVLYAREGREKARQEGRGMWVDRESGRITIVDRPDRIRAVDGYLRSLQRSGRTRRYEVIRLRHVESGTMASDLERLMRNYSSRGRTR